jgi:hypothetical protein
VTLPSEPLALTKLAAATDELAPLAKAAPFEGIELQAPFRFSNTLFGAAPMPQLIAVKQVRQSISGIELEGSFALSFSPRVIPFVGFDNSHGAVSLCQPLVDFESLGHCFQGFGVGLLR